MSDVQVVVVQILVEIAHQMPHIDVGVLWVLGKEVNEILRALGFRLVNQDAQYLFDYDSDAAEVLGHDRHWEVGLALLRLLLLARKSGDDVVNQVSLLRRISSRT